MNYILAAVYVFICMTTGAMAADEVSVQQDEVVLTEDTVWRGTIHVKGSVVVAPQATLRIDPGTIVRFAGVAAANSAPQ